MKQKNKGITLIALVITIIILLILAGITITSLINSGLFQKAQLAKEKAENSQNKEEIEIAKYNNEINSYISGNRDNNDIYSTTEQVIGKWINNKNIYRRVIEYTIDGNSSYDAITTIEENTQVEEIIRKEGWYKNFNGGYYDLSSVVVGISPNRVTNFN